MFLKNVLSLEILSATIQTFSQFNTTEQTLDSLSSLTTAKHQNLHSRRMLYQGGQLANLHLFPVLLVLLGTELQFRFATR